MERVAGPERERSSDEAPEEPEGTTAPPPAAASPTDLLVPPAEPTTPPAEAPHLAGDQVTGALAHAPATDAEPPTAAPAEPSPALTPVEPAPAFTPVEPVGPETPAFSPMGPIGFTPVAILGAAPAATVAPPPASTRDDWLAVGPAGTDLPPPTPRIVLRPSARLAPPPPATGRIPHLDVESLVAPARDDADAAAAAPEPMVNPAGPPPPAVDVVRPFDPLDQLPPLAIQEPPLAPPPVEAPPPLPARGGTGRLNIRILPRGAGGAPNPAAAASAIGSPVEDVSGAATARAANRPAPPPPPAQVTAPPARSASGPRPVTARVQGRVQTGLGGRVRAALRCPYCHDGVERQGGVACARRGCGALYHEACWRECVSHYGGCAVFGCGCRDVKGLTRVGLWVRVARLVLAAFLFPPRVIDALRDEGAGAEEVRRALEARANETDDAFWARTSTRVAPRTRAAWNLLQFAVPCVAMAVTMALLTGTGAIFTRPEAAILLMIAAGIGAVLALHQTSRVAALVVYYSRAVLDGEFAALARAGGVGGYLTRMRTGGQKPGGPPA